MKAWRIVSALFRYPYPTLNTVPSSTISNTHFEGTRHFVLSSITLFIAHFYYENHLPKFLSPRIRISHPSSHPSSIILFNHSCTYHPSFTLSSYISPHFIYQPLSTLSCHKHPVVTNLSFLLSSLIAFFLLLTSISLNFHHISLSPNHTPLKTAK